MTAIREEAEIIATKAGEDDDRSFHELMEERERANTIEDNDRFYEALRLLYMHADPRWKEAATRILRGN